MLVQKVQVSLPVAPRATNKSSYMLINTRYDDRVDKSTQSIIPPDDNSGECSRGSRKGAHPDRDRPGRKWIFLG